MRTAFLCLACLTLAAIGIQPFSTSIARLVPPSSPPPPQPSGPTITTTSLPDGIQNTAYTATLAATGGKPPYTWSITAGALPNGLTLSATSGIITGTPRGSGGTNTFTVKVIDAASQKASANLSITIQKRTR